MQLFTIGLFALTDDGSYELDAQGAPIETYTGENIEEFARHWTGFDLHPMRANIQNNPTSRGNRVDPMVIKANGGFSWRDLCKSLRGTNLLRAFWTQSDLRAPQ